MKHRNYISGLRAVAILPVVIFHFWPELLPGGFIGVSVFFVISGFLITYLIVDEVDRGCFSFRTFYARRVRRLLPAATAVFIVTFLGAVYLLAPEAFDSFGRSLVAADLIHANVYFADTTGYFSAPAHEKPLLHFWSLSIEEQFYLLWPLLAAGLLPRIARWQSTALILCLLLISLGMGEAMARTQADQAFYSFIARAWELMTGVLLALVIHRLKFHRRLAEFLGIAGLGAILVSCIWLEPSITFPGLSALPACLGTAAVLASGFQQSTWATRILSVRIMTYVGLISYSLYLWHWPILALSRYYLERPLLPSEAILLGTVSFAVAALSYHGIEQPFRAIDGRFRRNDGFTLKVGAAAVLLIAALGGLIQLDRGWVWRFGPQAQQLFEQRLAVNPWEARCDNLENIFSNDDFCNFGHPKPTDASFDIAVFGDSNADHFVPLLADYASRSGLSGRQVTQTACGSVLGIRLYRHTPAKQAECLTYQRSIIQFVERNPGLKLVFISAKWLSYQGKLVSNGIDIPGLLKELTPEDHSDIEILEYHLRRTIEFLRERAIQVHLISQIPYQNGLPIRCVLEALRAGFDTSHCGVGAAKAKGEIAPTDTLLQRLAAEIDGVSVTISTDIMCNPKTCPIVMDGVLLYRNETHLNAHGALLLGRYFQLPGIE
ncbi:MAG: acyltransferase family protein [Candidatus Competibacteraceae bacterium]|nr:acyltransferase family protein [Candidatus Competibacteraceae bacterium]